MGQIQLLKHTYMLQYCYSPFVADLLRGRVKGFRQLKASLLLKILLVTYLGHKRYPECILYKKVVPNMTLLFTYFSL